MIHSQVHYSFMPQSRFLLLCLAAAWMNSSPMLFAAIIASEDFDYDNVSVIDGLNGGLGWAGPWNGNGFITPGSLHLSRLGFTGHKATSQGSKCAYRKLSAAGKETVTDNGKFGKDGTTIWISFLISAPLGTTIPGYGGISLFEESRERVFIGDTGASNVWAIERQGQIQRFSSRVADSNACLIVCRMKFLPGEDRIDMWIDPSTNLLEPSEANTAASITNAIDFRFDGIRFCSAPFPMNCDALRFGTTYRDVIAVSGWTAGPWLKWIPWITSYVLLFLLICAVILLTLARTRRDRTRLPAS
jgi:hypothetical protein